MEQFLLDNAERYKKLVGSFKPPPSKVLANDSEVGNPDMVVAARVRPLLDEESEQGFPPAVFPREGSNTIDIHDLRRPVRGLPTLNVSFVSLSPRSVAIADMFSLSTSPWTVSSIKRPRQLRFTRVW